MAVYVDKSRLQRRMPPDRLKKFYTIRVPDPNDPENTIPVEDDDALEEDCESADTLTVSAVMPYYKGPHPISPVMGEGKTVKLLTEIACLYAEAKAYHRDPTYAKTYIDVSKMPQWKQAEQLVAQVQAGSRTLFDHGDGLPSGGRVGGLTMPDGSEPPQLFGSDYHGDL